MKYVVAFFAFLAVVTWFAFGTPKTDVGNVLWPNSAAPWENVIGFYYPNKSDLMNNVKVQNLNTLDACRAWAGDTIARSVDPTGAWSDYTCGVGCTSPTNAATCRLRLK